MKIICKFIICTPSGIKLIQSLSIFISISISIISVSIWRCIPTQSSHGDDGPPKTMGDVLEVALHFILPRLEQSLCVVDEGRENHHPQTHEDAQDEQLLHARVQRVPQNLQT